MEKIKDGALFAIGFTVVAIAIAYGFSAIYEQFGDTADYVFNDPAEGISIEESRIVRRSDRLVVLGKYKNSTDADLSNFRVNADFFGPDQTFLDQCDDYVSEDLAAGAEAYFKIECSSCADLTLDDVTSHTIYVSSGY